MKNFNSKGKSFESVKAPISEGEIYDEVVITQLSDRGDGIYKVKGFIVFVKNVKKNEKVKIKITKVLKSVGFAEVVERLGEIKVAPPPTIENKSVADSHDFGEEDEDDLLDEYNSLLNE